MVGEGPLSHRKYLAFWVAFGTTICLLLAGKINGDEYVEMQVVIFGLYMAGNVGEHAFRSRRGDYNRGRENW